MIEIPEAAVLAKQLTETVTGKKIRRVEAGKSPHKLAWFSGNPAAYNGRLAWKTPGRAVSHGGMVVIPVEGMTLAFGDGVNLHFHRRTAEQPAKHQLLLEFTNRTSLSATIAMYGGMWCFAEGSNDNPYYLAACSKPSPLTEAFDRDYFTGLGTPQTGKLTLKAFLATEQRIPGLGNGVLQDILFNARLHPKRRFASLNPGEVEALFRSVRDTLAQMEREGGRDTETDLFDRPGGYHTRMSRNTVGKPCEVCGSPVVKQAYMGGSIYFCPGCQVE